MSNYMVYARRLGARYRYDRPGADAQDVEQVALIAAWRMLERWDGVGVPPRRDVMRRMKLDVLDFVRARTVRARGELSDVPFDEGRDS